MREADLFSTGAVYHVYNRGVDKQPIFHDDADRIRFMKSVVLFNDQGRRKENSIRTVTCVRLSDTPCVEIIAYCLMPNHFHLMIKQLVHGGISEFMQRVGDGYTKYFNKRYERKGGLFEGPYQIKRVETTGYLQHLSRYIHLNPLELNYTWNTGKQTWNEARAALEGYAWSSYRHYAGIERIPFVRDEEVMRFFANSDDYLQFLRGFITSDCSPADRLAADIELTPTTNTECW